LGPLLFPIYINDLPKTLINCNNISSNLFADDLKSFTTYDNYLTDPQCLQLGLDQLLQWSQSWQLELAATKCTSLFIKVTLNHVDIANLYNKGLCLTTSDTVKYLGVFIDDKLQKFEQVAAVVSKSKKRIYLIFKRFFSRNIKLMVFAFKIYIMSLLECCSVIWSPYLLHNVDKIEGIQRYLTKRLEDLWDVSNSERLDICNLVPLELRRVWADLILCFKIVHKHIDLPMEYYFKLSTCYRTRGHNFKLSIPVCFSNVRRHFFATRVVSIWNSLSFEIVNLPYVLRFKNKLKHVNLDKFFLRNYTI